MLPESSSFDLVLIGGGPAGYVGAIRAAQLGLKVACVEMDQLGGVCLNWGCIPTKALLAAAEFYDKLKHEAGDWGISTGRVSHDWKKVISRSRQVAANLNKGVHGLFRKHKVAHIAGRAKITAPGQLQVTDQSGQVSHELAAKHVVIATGAEPRPLPVPGGEFDGERIISSKQAMVLAPQPKRLLIVGAGAIGMEFAYFYHAFGTEVVMVEMLDHLLPNEDHEVSAAIEKAWRKQKIEYHVKTKTLGVTKKDNGVSLTIAPTAKENETQVLTGDVVLVAVGVKGKYEGLFDEALGIAVEKDHIKVNAQAGDYQTNLPGVYAVGDVIGPPWLAHVAMEEAVACVEKIAGHAPDPIDYDAIPGCTYCRPQVASLGKTQQACEADGMKAGADFRVGKFPFIASGKAQAAGETQGFVKVIADEKHGAILGVHMIGEHVTELIAELGLAMRLEATVEEVIATMHAHPTLSEAVHESMLATAGRVLHA